IAVLSVRHVDKCLGKRHRGGSGYKQQREREACRSIPWRFHVFFPDAYKKGPGAFCACYRKKPRNRRNLLASESSRAYSLKSSCVCFTRESRYISQCECHVRFGS